VDGIYPEIKSSATTDMNVLRKLSRDSLVHLRENTTSKTLEKCPVKEISDFVMACIALHSMVVGHQI
jgi:hypothetical protein